MTAMRLQRGVWSWEGNMARSEHGLAVPVVLAVALLSAATLSVHGAEPVAAGLVLAVSGPGVVKATGADRRLAPMAVIDRGETIATGPGGTILLLFFPDGREYTLAPESSARLGGGAVERLGGSVSAAAGTASAPVLPRTSRLSSSRVAGEMVRAQSPFVGFLSPPPNGTVLDPAPDYRWALARPRSTSRLTVLDAAGRELGSRTVKGDLATTAELGLPPLQAGREYTAQLCAVDGRGEPDLTTLLITRFQVLDAREAEEVRQARAEAEAARQADPKALAATFKLLFLLTERRLHREAQQTGELLREQLPDNPNVLRFLALSYRESGQSAAANQALREAERIDPGGK